MSDKNKNLHLLNKFKRLFDKHTVAAPAHDIVAAILAWFFAYQLRFNFNLPPEYIASFWQVALFTIPIQSIYFIQFGLYKGVWRFASLPDLKRILMAIIMASVTIATLLYMFKPVYIIVPRSVLLLNPILLMMMMAGSRFIYRSWKEHQLYGLNQIRGEPVLVLGAGDAAIGLLRDLDRSQEWRVIGLLDDNSNIHGRSLLGVNILGGVANLPEVANKLGVKNVIVAKPAEAHQARRRAIEIATHAGLNVFTVPSVEDLMNGNISISKIRHVEIEDLLGRDAVQLDNSGLQHLIKDRAVLVSGAGGSIGSELCRQIVKFKPSTLICLDISEFSLYNLEQEFSRLKLSVNLLYMTGDVKNGRRMSELLAEYKPAVVFHAAAYKHVPLMENGNVFEALSNNVLGTYTLAKACREANVEKFVLISTDKAVNPTNVMGASKRLAEMVCQGLQSNLLSNGKSSTKFVIVRFGNVLGSSGSVIPKFREQIAKGGPITITHPEITRYFMSIPEAAQLVMQAGVMGQGGEIFVLDMGESVKIADLAKDMIHLSGLQLEDIKIEYIGLRPGEKLYEELLADDENTLPTPHEKLRVASARNVNEDWVHNLLRWIETLQSADEEHIKTELKLWVEEYSPQLKASAKHKAKAEAIAETPKQMTLH
jgi:FlaA1/EpsC-like NDP-sugar epimerase